MKLYNILLLLHGEMNNQVRKELVSAAEITLLRGMHIGNNEPIKDVVHVANTTRTDAAERRRLALLYGTDTFALDGDVPVTGIQLVNRHFPPGTPLPQEIVTDTTGNILGEDFSGETIEFVNSEHVHPVEAAMRDARAETVTPVGQTPVPQVPAKAAPSPEIVEMVEPTDDPFADDGVEDIKIEPATPRRSPLRTGTRTAV